MSGFSNSMMGMRGQSVHLAAAQTDNLELESSIVLVTPQNTLDEITGAMPLFEGGALIWIVNIDPTKSLVLPFDDSGSDAGYRWLNILGHDLTVGPGETAQFAYVAGLGWEFLKPAILT